MEQDCICAISTPPGRAALALIRLSGIGCIELVSGLFVRKNGSGAPPAGKVCHGEIHWKGRFLDDVVLWCYRAPRSFTGEEMVEISCHGSPYICEAILNALTCSGARLAEPGEFTRRAFLNGKLNLSQSEAIADLIDSTNATQHSLAVSQLRGGYAKKLKELRQQLLDLTSLMELELDFSQEDVEFADRTQLTGLIGTLNTHLKSLISSFTMGNALKRGGIPVAIIGAPNAGKSTLLNALIEDERAIVSPIPGTTRDTIEESMTIDGITFLLIDTAGLRNTDDTVERLGIERSRKAQEEAMIILEVVDASTKSDVIPETVLHEGKRHIVALNKTDLVEGHIKTAGQSGKTVYVGISALHGDGLDQLKQALVAAGRQQIPNDTLLTNVRHRDALVHVRQALERVSQGMGSGIPTDLLAIDLRDALHHLGTITGEVTSDEVLGNIFSRFCVGK